MVGKLNLLWNKDKIVMRMDSYSLNKPPWQENLWEHDMQKLWSSLGIKSCIKDILPLHIKWRTAKTDVTIFHQLIMGFFQMEGKLVEYNRLNLAKNNINAPKQMPKCLKSLIILSTCLYMSYYFKGPLRVIAHLSLLPMFGIDWIRTIVIRLVDIFRTFFTIRKFDVL
jgi:hypothetical protein